MPFLRFISVIIQDTLGEEAYQAFYIDRTETGYFPKLTQRMFVKRVAEDEPPLTPSMIEVINSIPQDV